MICRASAIIGGQMFYFGVASSLLCWNSFSGADNLTNRHNMGDVNRTSISYT